jgi:hypothetical protein
MRLVVRTLVTLLGLALSGCYVSDRLLIDPGEAAHPIEDGTYVRDGDPHDELSITLEPDGWYAVAKYNNNGLIGRSHRVLATPADLGGEEGFILAEQTGDGFTYAIGRLEGGRVYLATPDCSDPLDRSDAVDQGGEARDDGPMSNNCLFRSRAALMAALSGFAGHAVYGEPYQRH